jgi:hypothetical protein
MAGFEESAQQAQLLQVTYVQAVGRRIEADVQRHPTGINPAGQIFLVCELMDQASPAQVFYQG